MGHAARPFSIQSISKALVFALACDALGHDTVRKLVGVNSTGLPSDPVMAIELDAGSPVNPMVNAGELAVTALVPGASAAAKWQFGRAAAPPATSPIRRPAEVPGA